MRPFNHILSLLAFVFAVALTQLLTRMGGLLVARKKVKSYGLTALTALLAVQIIFTNWLSIWEVHNKVQWNLPTIGSLFLFVIAVYFISVFALPAPESNGPTDLEEFYWSHRVPYYIAWLACELLAILCNLQFSDDHNSGRMLSENLSNVLTIPPILLALVVAKRWAQWTGGLLLLTVNAYFLFTFDVSLA
ncbi:MAG TPA: hypothetical protein VGM36_09180 [Rhizomicrobium sp.]